MISLTSPVPLIQRSRSKVGTYCIALRFAQSNAWAVLRATLSGHLSLDNKGTQFNVTALRDDIFHSAQVQFEMLISDRRRTVFC